MISVSAAFKTATTATVRKPKARVTITWTDPYLDVSIATSTNDENRTSQTSQVADLNETTGSKWAHLADGFIADGSFKVMPDGIASAADNQVGWYGKTLSGVAGAFSLPYPYLEITFAARPILQIRVIGDTVYGEYPVDFTVALYNGGTLLNTQAIVGNAAVVWSDDITALNLTEVDKMVLTISKWSDASQIVKINEFYASIVSVYDGDDIISMNHLEENEIRDGTLPVGNISSNDLNLELQNVENAFYPGNTASVLHTLIRPNRKIFAEIGFELPSTAIEYVPLGTFWSGDWSTPELGVSASTTARDRMELLRKSSFYTGEVYENYTLYQLAEIVLEDARVNFYNDLEYNISSNLSSFSVPWAWFSRKSHFEALKDIAGASIGQCYVDRLGVVQLIGYVAGTATVLTDVLDDNYFEKDQPAKTEELKNIIEVSTQPLLPEDSDEVYQGEEATAILNGATVSSSIKFSKPPVINATVKAYDTDSDGTITRDGSDNITNTELTVSSSTIYAWGADVSVTNGSGVSTYYIIIVTGQAMTVQGSQVFVDEDTTSKNENGALTYTFPKNHLVQSEAVATLIASTLLAGYKDFRKDIKLSWRGDPSIELYDNLRVYTYKKDTVATRGAFKIFKQNLSFDGTLTMVTSARKLQYTEPGLLYQDTTDTSKDKWQDTTDILNNRLQDTSYVILP